MKATVCCLGAVLLAGLSSSAVFAQGYPPHPYAYPSAPDACGPGFYAVNEYGAPYGPNYNLYPGFPPFNGARPCVGGGGPGGPGGFPTHPFARSPRDFFMWTEANEDAISRLRLPALVPVAVPLPAPVPGP
jgi:hypothetical protein